MRWRNPHQRLKRTKELWGKAVESAKSWKKDEKEKIALERKKFLETCDAVIRMSNGASTKPCTTTHGRISLNDFKTGGGGV